MPGPKVNAAALELLAQVGEGRRSANLAVRRPSHRSAITRGAIRQAHWSRCVGRMRNRQTVTQADVGALLESFVRSRHYVPPGARRIRSREELPLALQSHTQEVDSAVWRAWQDGSRIWFVKAKPVSCEYTASLQVMFFDMDGRLAGSGAWIWLAHRGWVLSDPAAVM